RQEPHSAWLRLVGLGACRARTPRGRLPANVCLLRRRSTAPHPSRLGSGRGMAHQETPAREAEGQFMTMTDPIADMLTRLRNANSAYHDSVAMPHSKIKSHIAEILQQEGFITGWKVEDAEVGKNLVLELKFG